MSQKILTNIGNGEIKERNKYFIKIYQSSLFPTYMEKYSPN